MEKPAASSSPNWGAKRSRTRLYRRDWESLGEGPLGLIAERVLADDVVDYIRFRAVCLSWRRCCPAPRERGGVLDDRRLYPRRWIMLLGERETLEAAAAPHISRRLFLNVSTGRSIQVDVPENRRPRRAQIHRLRGPAPAAPQGYQRAARAEPDHAPDG